MPKWIAAVFVSVCLCAPNCAFAGTATNQSGDIPTKDIPTKDILAKHILAKDILAGDILGVSKEQALVVAAGVLGGALVLHLVFPGDLTYFAGGVVGGLAALWWYEDGGETRLHPSLKPARAAAGGTAHGSPLVAGLALGR
ncbi:MAG TPA: hypothetical protein VGS13_06760 [Stellaceae bacterium]|nr:hypothetical protein [Stellaceae bacterium]